MPTFFYILYCYQLKMPPWYWVGTHIIIDIKCIIFTTISIAVLYKPLLFYIYTGGLSTVALQGATVSVLNNSVCENMFRSAGYIKKIPDTFICAGSKDGGYDACKVSIYVPTSHYHATCFLSHLSRWNKQQVEYYLVILYRATRVGPWLYRDPTIAG